MGVLHRPIRSHHDAITALRIVTYFNIDPRPIQEALWSVFFASFKWSLMSRPALRLCFPGAPFYPDLGLYTTAAPIPKVISPQTGRCVMALTKESLAQAKKVRHLVLTGPVDPALWRALLNPPCRIELITCAAVVPQIATSVFVRAPHFDNRRAIHEAFARFLQKKGCSDKEARVGAGLI